MDDKVGCENDDESEKDGDQQTVAFMRRRLCGEFRKREGEATDPNATNAPGSITAREQVRLTWQRLLHTCEGVG